MGCLSGGFPLLRGRFLELPFGCGFWSSVRRTAGQTAESAFYHIFYSDGGPADPGKQSVLYAVLYCGWEEQTGMGERFKNRQVCVGDRHRDCDRQHRIIYVEKMQEK